MKKIFTVLLNFFSATEGFLWFPAVITPRLVVVYSRHVSGLDKAF